MQKENINNKVTIIGVISDPLTFDHEFLGEKFYSTTITADRKSGYPDAIPLIISDVLIDCSKFHIGQTLKISGEFRSYNQNKKDQVKLGLYVFVKDIDFEDVYSDSRYNNQVQLSGFVCKPPTYRKTPLGREICDLLVAVNRPSGKSDCIPCIVWGRATLRASYLDVGAPIDIYGRIQSRIYEKQISDTETVTRTAYEVSVNRFLSKEY